MLCEGRWERRQLWNLLQTTELKHLLKFAPLLPMTTLRKVIYNSLPATVTAELLERFMTTVTVNIVLHRLKHRNKGPDFDLPSITDESSWQTCPSGASGVPHDPTELLPEPELPPERKQMSELEGKLRGFFKEVCEKKDDFRRDILEAPEMGRWSEFLWAASCHVFCEVAAETLAKDFQGEDSDEVLRRIKSYLTSNNRESFAELRFNVFKKHAQLIEPCAKINGEPVKQNFVERSKELTNKARAASCGASSVYSSTVQDEKKQKAQFQRTSSDELFNMLEGMSLDEVRKFAYTHGSKVPLGITGGRTKRDIVLAIVQESYQLSA